MTLPRIVVLTGAGISAESGLQTFREPTGAGPALWAGHSVEDVATASGYRRNPGLAHDFYRARRAEVAAAEPNAAHHALGLLATEYGDKLLLVTQNVDDLHERGGVAGPQLIHMHGQLATAICTLCREPVTAGECGAGCPICFAGTLRPDVVFFGETPKEMPRINRALAAADLFIAIGTSGDVYPAAGFVDKAIASRARTIELNLHASDRFTQFRGGPATVTVPALVAELLS